MGPFSLLVALYYRRFLALCFDEEQALLQGVAVKRLYLLLLSLVAVSIVLLIQIIGTILVIALLTIPATCRQPLYPPTSRHDGDRRRVLRPF